MSTKKALNTSAHSRQQSVSSSNMLRTGSAKWPHYNSDQRYDEWEKDFPWVKRTWPESNIPSCKWCHTTLQPKCSNLASHAQSEKHKRMGPKLPGQPTAFCHSAISFVDHLGEVLIKHGKDSDFANLWMHRTKCSKLITRVISPAFKADLKNQLCGQKFVVRLDEATDIGVTKHLCLVVRYLSRDIATIETQFLDLVPMLHSTRDDLFDALTVTLKQFNMDLKDCIGVGSDGTSVMVGVQDSLWTRIKACNPDVILIRYICHSLSLAIEKAFDHLPSSFGFPLVEVPQWFQKSNSRQHKFVELFNTMNPNDERKGTPLPFQKLSQTRWLVRGKVLGNILANWHELTA